jgi:hypothetical protein
MKDELVAVVCYKKGAAAIKQLLDRFYHQKACNRPRIKSS